jgi:hypothetical protein
LILALVLLPLLGAVKIPKAIPAPAAIPIDNMYLMVFMDI